MEEMCRSKLGKGAWSFHTISQRETFPASPRIHQPRSSVTLQGGGGRGGRTAILMLSSGKVSLYKEFNFFSFSHQEYHWWGWNPVQKSQWLCWLPMLCVSSGEGAWARLMNSGVNCSRGGPTCRHWSRVLLCKCENCLACWVKRWGIHFWDPTPSRPSLVASWERPHAWQPQTGAPSVGSWVWVW